MDVAACACPNAHRYQPKSASRRGAAHAWQTREMREARASDQEAHEAAVTGVQQVWPRLSWKEASAEPSAIAYATKYHRE
jgi:hypothetical protein